MPTMYKPLWVELVSLSNAKNITSEFKLKVDALKGRLTAIPILAKIGARFWLTVSDSIARLENSDADPWAPVSAAAEAGETIAKLHADGILGTELLHLTIQ